MMNTIKIGDQLKALRRAKGLTTDDLAKKVSVSQSYISRFENNKAIPDIDMLQKILTALNTDLAKFFSTDINMPEDVIRLINTIQTMSPEARKKLDEFLKIMQKESNKST